MTSKAALFFLAALLLLFSAHRLPAPITELADTPTPTPAVASPPLKSPPVKTSTPKPVKEKSPARTSPHPAASASPAAASVKRFAGTWTGILAWSFFGDTEFRLVVDPSEKVVTRVTRKWAERPVARAEIHGDTLIARFPGMHGTFELTLNQDGRTAIVHGTAPTVDSTAVFRRQ
jgi:hypothetical protein